MNEILLLAGGFYMVALIVFHGLFWHIFGWPGSLKALDGINQSTIQVLNLSITFIFGIFAYITFVHTDELLHTGLGKTLLVSIALLWLFRAVLQVVFYGARHKASIGLAIYFLGGALLYGIPGFT